MNRNVARSTLPEYLEAPEVEALIRAAPSPQARLLLLVLWRAGLRVSEALALEAVDFRLDAANPTVHVRHGKGGKARYVPLHPELRAAVTTVLAFGSRQPGTMRIFGVTRKTAWEWVKAARLRAEALGAIVPGRRIGTHTFRHSAARHWLASGIAINKVQVWLGHSSLVTTTIYLRILPDASGDMSRVP